MKRMLFALAVSTFLFTGTAGVAQETWNVASLDWQPFSGKTIPEGGAGIAVLRAALKAEGIDLNVEFYPWSRAVDQGRDPSYIGYYPSWPEDVVAGFTKSPVFFKSPVGFVEPKDKPLVWLQLEDLRGKKIGIVQGYGNTPEFMALVKSGVIKTEAVADDLTNVKKVAAGRLDGAFIDLINLDYYLKYDAKGIASGLRANPKIVTTKDLVLAINGESSNKNVAEIVKRGLSKIDPDKIIRDYMAKYLR